MNQLKNNYFDENGWCLPSGSDRTFSKAPKWFYKLNTKEVRNDTGIKRLNKLIGEFPITKVQKELDTIKSNLEDNSFYSNLTKGIALPFVLEKNEVEDIGYLIESEYLKILVFDEELPPRVHTLLDIKSALKSECIISRAIKYLS